MFPTIRIRNILFVMHKCIKYTFSWSNTNFIKRFEMLKIFVLCPSIVYLLCNCHFMSSFFFTILSPFLALVLLLTLKYVHTASCIYHLIPVYLYWFLVDYTKLGKQILCSGSGFSSFSSCSSISFLFLHFQYLFNVCLNACISICSKYSAHVMKCDWFIV